MTRSCGGVDPVAGTGGAAPCRPGPSWLPRTTSTSHVLALRREHRGEVRATGIMVTTHFPEGEQPAYGTLVDERTYAPFHQHFIVAWRWTSTWTAAWNTARTVRGAADGPDNLDGLAIVQRSTPLRTEEEGKQDYDWSTQRAWKIVNEEKHNVLARRRWATSSVPGGALLDARSVLWRGRRHSDGHSLWVLRMRRTSAGPAASSRSRARRTAACPPGRGQPPDREHRRGALVRVRNPPHHAAGGVAGDGLLPSRSG